jgi:hypothetical protein
MAEQIAQDLPIVFLVFDNENESAHASPTWLSTLTGTMNENVAP